ncbi:hypothetical protein RRF57_011984 [Xylaria bambusicola]|uniref:Uncharacterized protein n=1 Tax=Xylaria bambusicola TaxID=326684 RepID=A0AAN7ZAI8_9PEZI
MEDTLAQIKSTISELSSTAQNDELDRLERHRDQLLADLQASFQKEKEELEAKRQKELEDIKRKRQQEDEERAARRRREDEELKKATSAEDNNRQQKHDNEVGSIEDETERKMDEVEQTAEKKIEEGKKKLRDLDEKRKELNRRIDDQLTQSFPASPPRRKRSKDRSKKQPGELSRDSSKVQEDGLPGYKPGKQEDGVPEDKLKEQENGLPKDSSIKQDDSLPSDKSKQDDKFEGDKSTSNQDGVLTNEKSKKQDNEAENDKSNKQEDKLPEDKSMGPEKRTPDGQKSEKSEKSKKQENEPSKDKSKKQAEGLPQDQLKNQKDGSSKGKSNGQGDERLKEETKKQENESPKNKSKKHEDKPSQDESVKQQNGLPKNQASSLEEEQPKEKPKKQESDSSKKSKKREDELQKNGINGGSTSDGQQNDDLSPKPKKDSSSKPKQSDSKSSTPTKSRPPVPSSPERSSESKKDGEPPSQVDRTIGSPQAAKKPAKNAPRSFADALKSNMSNGLKDNPEREESNASHVAQQQDIPGDLASVVPTTEPETEAHRSETTTIEKDGNTTGWIITEKPNSLLDEKSKSRKNKEKGGKEVLHRNSSSKPAKSNDGPPNTYSIPKPAEEPKLQKEETPEKFTSDSQSISTEHSNVTVPFMGNSTKREDNQQPTGQPSTSISHKTDLNQSSRTAGGGTSPKTLERSPIKNRVLCTDANSNSEDPKSTIQPQRLSATPDKRRSGQENRPHNPVEFRQPAVSYFPEQTQSRGDGSSANVLKQPQTLERLSQAQSESAFLAPPSPIQGDIVLSLDEDELDISPQPGTPMGFEHIQNSNSEFLHVIRQQGQEKVTSPLPVENETVRGEEQLFDESKSVSDFSEHGMGEEEFEPLSHMPIEGGQPVLLESPFQSRFDDQGLTPLIGAFQKWARLIKEINEQSDASLYRPLLLEYPHAQEGKDPEVPDAQIITGNNKLPENRHGNPHQGIRGNRQPASEPSSPWDTPTFSIHNFAHEAAPNLSRSSSLSQNTDSHSQATPIVPLCNNPLTDLVGSTSESSDIVSHSVAPAHSDASKRKLRSSSTESHRNKKQRGRQKYKSCQSPERNIDPRGQLFQNSDEDIDIRSSWFKHSKRGLG